MLYVTHDQVEAMTLATRIGVIERGRLVQLATPREIYECPANIYVAARLGQPGINLMPRGLFPEAGAPPAAVTIGARTEHLRIVHSATAAHGRVTWIEHLGDRDHLHVRIGGTDVVTLADPDAGLAVDDDVAIELVCPLYFDKDGNRVAA
jgi:multiple sugar transport system ATP-binding protein